MLVSVAEWKKSNEAYSVDMLPCYFFKDEENIKRSVYFDSQIEKYKETKKTENEENHNENDVIVSLRGHKIIGREVDTSFKCESEDRQLEYQIGLVNVEENKTDNNAKIFILDPIEKLTVWEEGGEYNNQSNLAKLQTLLKYRNILCSESNEDE